MALTGKTIGELTLLEFPTNDSLIPVEYSGNTYHIIFSSITSNLTAAPFLPLSGGTVTGNTIFTSGLTANTISATTYQNLPIENNLTPSTTVAPSKTAVNTAISPTTGVTFNGSAISLDKVTGTSYLPYTQVSAITFTLSGTSVGLGFAAISITANGSAITPIASWKNVGNDVISVVNGAVNRFIITQVENEVWFTVKVN